MSTIIDYLKKYWWIALGVILVWVFFPSKRKRRRRYSPKNTATRSLPRRRRFKRIVGRVRRSIRRTPRRATRRRGKKGKLRKGSPEAKRYMAKIRRMRKK